MVEHANLQSKTLIAQGKSPSAQIVTIFIFLSDPTLHAMNLGKKIFQFG